MDNALPQSVSIENSYGWPGGSERFLWNQSLHSNITVDVIKRILPGHQGSVDEVVVNNHAVPVVRYHAPVGSWKMGKGRKRKAKVIEAIRRRISLKHPHLQEVLGSYLDQTTHALNLLVAPAIHLSLEDVLSSEFRTTSHRDTIPHLKRWFACMASALSYLHGHKMAHGSIRADAFAARGSSICLVGIVSWDVDVVVNQGWYQGVDSTITLPENEHFASDVAALSRVYMRMTAFIAGPGVNSTHDPNESLHGDSLLGASIAHGQFQFQDFWLWLTDLPQWLYNDVDVHCLHRDCLDFMTPRLGKPVATATDIHRILSHRYLDFFGTHVSCACTPDTLVVQRNKTRAASGWQIGKEAFLWDRNAETALSVTKRGTLGLGSKGEVDEVQVPGFDTTMARKRMPITRVKRHAKVQMQRIRSEIEILRDLTHQHIVQALGCYQNSESAQFYLLLSPAGDQDLRYFLEEVCKQEESEQLKATYKRWIQTWFGCLASALAYLHCCNVQHEDIKPANIIHRGETVYFTDFSSARQLEPGQDTSTDSPALATRLFAAPELFPEADQNPRHGSKTDVFSLGLVFAEMLSVMSGSSVEQMREFVFPGVKEPSFYHRVAPGVFRKWFQSLGQEYGMFRYMDPGMLAHDREKRYSAQAIADNIRDDKVFGPSNGCYCQWIRWDKHDLRVKLDEDDDYAVVLPHR